MNNYYEEERWVMINIDNFKDYEISDYGKVASYKSGKRRLLTAVPDKDGYLRYGLVNNDGIQKTLKAHRLVAIHFIPNPNGYEDVNHIDDNPANNYYKNLVWCTSAYNTAYRTDKNFTDYGYMHVITRMENVSIENQNIIKDMYYRQYIPWQDICKQFNISEYCFRTIIHGGRAEYSKFRKEHIKIMEPIKPEIKVTQRRLSEEEVLEIYNKIHNFNYSPRQIIQEYGISKSNVSAIKKLKIHSHLAGTKINPETNRLIIMRRKE